MYEFKISLSVQNEFLLAKSEISVLSEVAMNITNLLRCDVRCSGRYLPTVRWNLSSIFGLEYMGEKKMAKDTGKRRQRLG